MQDELDALHSNGTGSFSFIPNGVKSIASKWIFITKVNPDGSILKHKVQLDAKGFLQTYG